MNLQDLSVSINIFREYLVTDYKFEDNSICIRLDKTDMSKVDYLTVGDIGWDYDEETHIWSYTLNVED